MIISLKEEKGIFNKYQKVLDVEEGIWRLKSWSFWLTTRDINFNLFHKHAKDRLSRNNVNEIKTPSKAWTSYFENIKEATLTHFTYLYIDKGGVDSRD